MVIHFRELAEEQHRASVAPYAAQIDALKEDWVTGRSERFAARIAQLDARLRCEPLTHDEWILGYEHPSAIPLAEWIVARLGGPRRLSVGRPAGSFSQALEAAADFGVDLSTSRVRVGFGRGHLLDVYVLVPLDVKSDAEDLQVAAEIFLETFVGDRLLDTWVAVVAVDRTTRTNGLRMVSDIGHASISYPISEAKDLIHRGISGLHAELPRSLLEATGARADWTALAIEPACSEETLVLQPDRLHASTRFPEALKACLLGLPFSSERFTQGGEICAWFSWRARSKAERATKQRGVEFLFEDAERKARKEGHAPPFILAGTGFGKTTDYVDFWIHPENQKLRFLGNEMAATVGTATLGFYDSVWFNERIVFSATSAFSQQGEC